MFIIRTAFWLTLIILLLPTGEEQQREVYGTAEAAVKDIRTFCVRNPDVCETSKSAFDTFSQKAQFGVKMLASFVKGEGESGYTGSVVSDPAEVQRASGIRPDGQNTLTNDDLRPEWAAPRASSGT